MKRLLRPLVLLLLCIPRLRNTSPVQASQSRPRHCAGCEGMLQPLCVVTEKILDFSLRFFQFSASV
jgi:hypothetical protein